MSEGAKVKILGVGFDRVTIDEATERFVGFVKNEKFQGYAVTPNSEILLKAKDDLEYLNFLNGAALSIADGAGQIWAADFLKRSKNMNWGQKFFYFWKSLFAILGRKERGEVLPMRVTGVDLMEKICERSGVEGFSIFLIGAAEGVAHEVVDKMEAKYPGCNFAGAFAGNAVAESDVENLALINMVSPDVVFVAFGAPKQELWIKRNLSKMPSVKMAVGVGGAFDFLSGRKKRSPKWMRKLGLEWLYRLILEPSRIKRIWNAVVIFPIEVFKSRYDD